MAFGDLKKRPNILILITDQERSVQHWPPGWAEKNLPAMRRLMETGLTFNNAHCNSCTCSPSRVTMFTGLYPAQHGVTQVLEFDDPTNAALQMQISLQSRIQNMAAIMQTAGYNVVYKGKWHLTKPVSFLEKFGRLYWTAADREHIAAKWGFQGWNWPDAGDNMDLENFGGGTVNNDGRFVDGNGQAAFYGAVPTEDLERESIVHFLKSYDSEKPFCLIASLVNPHDVLSYPGTAGSMTDGMPLYQAGGYNLNDFKDLPIGLPGTVDEDLSTKPSAQTYFRELSAIGAGAVNTEEKQLHYVRFYAWLCRHVDGEIMKILNALDHSGKTDETLIIRISDHGEMGMAHGRLRQKMYNVYKETLNIPMIFSNPLLFSGQRTDALAGLIDILPTLTTICDVPERERWTFKGRDLTPVLHNPQASVQDYIHFTYDDLYMPVPGPNRIRCIVEQDWKYAVYYDQDTGKRAQYEMYDLKNDPSETHNLAWTKKSATPAIEQERQRLHKRLSDVMDELGTKPDAILWPKVSGFDVSATIPAEWTGDGPDTSPGSGR